MKMKLFVLCLAVGTCAVLLAQCRAGEDQPRSAANDDVEVELFAAVKSGQLQIVIIAQNYSLMTVRARNITDDVLNVLLPKSFAALPTARWQKQQTLRQQGHVPSLSDGYAIDPTGSQGLAASLLGPSASGMQTGDSGDVGAPAGHTVATSAWTLRPGQRMEIQLPCFCLEYNAPTSPNRRIAYTMVELQDLNNQPAIQELLDRFRQGNLDQRIVQLAAWRVCGVPWETLADVKFARSSLRNGGRVSAQELTAARQLLESLPSYAERPPSPNDR